MPAPKGHPPYPGCETGGRPKKYTKEFMENEAELLREWMKDKNNIFIGDFCFDRDYGEARIDEFVKTNEKFSEVYSKFKLRQKTEIIKGGLKRRFAHPMCALLLSNCHDMYLRTEQKTVGEVSNPLAFALQSVDGTTKDLVNESRTIFSD
jgi:hypothetical protein